MTVSTLAPTSTVSDFNNDTSELNHVTTYTIAIHSSGARKCSHRAAVEDLITSNIVNCNEFSKLSPAHELLSFLKILTS